jgi:hypothetical protein
MSTFTDLSNNNEKHRNLSLFKVAYTAFFISYLINSATIFTTFFTTSKKIISMYQNFCRVFLKEIILPFFLKNGDSGINTSLLKDLKISCI